jgi:predicted transposase YdaD
MGDKDIVSKEIIKEIGRDISMHILGIDIQGEVTLVDKEWTRVEKRDSDIVFKNNDKIFHIEIQNDNHKNMELRMLRYYSDILFEYKECSVEQYVVYIGKKRCNMKSEIARDRISYNYDIIDVKDIACEDLLYHSNPSAVALSILCDFKDRDKQMVVNTILQRIKELTDGDEVEYQNYIKKVNVLSTNRDLKEEVKKGMNNMLQVDITKTPLYELAMEKGMEKGLEKGMEKGMEKGIFDTAIIMMEKMNHSIDEIVKVLNIKKEELLEYMKKKKEEA